MQQLFFVTGNQGKLREIQDMLPDVQGIDMDLTEIQELDAHKIIAAKLAEAQKHHAGTFIVEDTSLYIDTMNGLPGPLVKWFLKTIGSEGIYKLYETFQGRRAIAQTLVGYVDEQGNIHYFEGQQTGTLVAPRGKNGFGWDPIFQPDGSTRTFAEMSLAEKYQHSMRRQAIAALQRYLDQQHV